MRMKTKLFLISFYAVIGLNAATTMTFLVPGTTKAVLLDSSTDEIQSLLELGDASNCVISTLDNSNLFFGLQNLNTLDNYSAQNPSLNSLFVVPNFNSKQASIPVGNNPVAAASTSDGRKTFIANYTDGTVSVVDNLTKSLSATISVGDNPTSIAISKNDQKAVVANSGSGSVSVIDLNSLVASDVDLTGVDAGAEPFQVAITKDSAFAYVSDKATSNIYKIRLSDASLESSISALGATSVIKSTPGGKYIAALSPDENALNLIKTADDSIQSVTVGTKPTSMAILATGKRIYIGNQGSKDLSLIDLIDGEVSATATQIPTLGSPVSVVATQDQKRLYILEMMTEAGAQLGATAVAVGCYDAPTGVRIKTIPAITRALTGLLPNPDPFGLFQMNTVTQAQLTASQAQVNLLGRLSSVQTITKGQNALQNIGGKEDEPYNLFLERNGLIEN